MSQFYRSPSSDVGSSANSSTAGRYDRRRSKHTFKSFRRFIYNRKEHTICHRTLKNWVILLSFYVILLGVLFGILFGLLAIILNILMKNRAGPHFGKADLMSNPSPALSIYPRLPINKSPLIWYTRKGEPSEHMIHPSFYVNQIDTFLHRYDTVESRRYVNCEKTLPKEGQYCAFSKSDLGACGNRSIYYGYSSDSPCVLLKLNMIENWKPSRKRKKTYIMKATDDNKISTGNTNMSLYDHNETSIVYPFEMIGVYCEGLTPFDEEYMGKMSFSPWAGFKEYFFPYDGSADYLRPLIGLQFINITRGLVIGVKCTITNIENMKNPLLHSVHFYLYIDRD